MAFDGESEFVAGAPHEHLSIGGGGDERGGDREGDKGLLAHPNEACDRLSVVVLVDLAHVQHWLLLVDVPKNDLTVHRATCQDNWLSRMK